MAKAGKSGGYSGKSGKAAYSGNDKPGYSTGVRALNGYKSPGKFNVYNNSGKATANNGYGTSTLNNNPEYSLSQGSRPIYSGNDISNKIGSSYSENNSGITIMYQSDGKGNERLAISLKYDPKTTSKESYTAQLEGIEKILSSYIGSLKGKDVDKPDGKPKSLQDDYEEDEKSRLGKCIKCGIPMIGEGICPRCLVEPSYSMN